MFRRGGYRKSFHRGGFKSRFGGFKRRFGRTRRLNSYRVSRGGIRL